MTMPEWIAVGTADTTGTASVAPGYGTNIAGDTFVMIVSGRITAFTTPTGWTLQGGGNDQAGRRVYILTRNTRSTGGESGTVTVTLTGNSVIATIHTWRGVATSSFIEDVTNAGSAANGSTLTAPTIDAGGNARVAMFVSASGSQITYIEVTGESGGDWRLRHQLNTATGSNCDYALYTADLPVGGTISGGTATIAGIDEHSIVSLALVGDAADGTPYPVAAGAGVSGTGTLAVPQVSAPSGTRAYVQVFVRAGSGQAPNTPSGWSLVAGPHAGTSGTCQQWVFRENTNRTGSESGTLSITFAAGASQKTARMYAMANDSGSAVEDVDVALSTDTPVAMAPVTAASTFRRAVAFVGIDDDNTIAAATGATGGTWSEPYDEYFGGVNTCIQMQTAGLNAGGTITGGSAVMSGTDDAIVSSFAIVGVTNTVNALFALPFESLSSVTATKAPNLEALSAPTANKAVSLEALRQVSSTKVVPIEGLVQVSSTKVVNTEALAGLVFTRGVQLEALAVGAAAKAVNLEALVTGTALKSGNIEALVSGLSQHLAPLEALQGVVVARPVSAEALQGVSVGRVVLLEALGSVTAPVLVPIESLGGYSFGYELNIEAIAAASVVFALSELNIEALAAMEVTKQVQLEALAAPVLAVRTMQLEALGGWQGQYPVQLEALGSSVAPTAVQLEALRLGGSMHALPLEALQRTDALLVLNYEGSATTSGFALLVVNVEALRRTVALSQVQLEGLKLFFIVEPEHCGALRGVDRVGSLVEVDRVGLLRSR